ncbi:5-amino-6-(5-phospho-D-ribitylamino)uracil phosphatase YigB [[Haemophilus] felis]|uniref:HAD family hydrolase n=1 Tax=[Haemophilus] felis TaxID=123822 RepID=A0A1T0B8D6_9PAST|nr:5-amino-6-(5-phospho-D-ribitylamino)uracil phosphatase YigB [[Haemophilus] felis]NBI41003.1 5-amino-6-(5-phospho-D-ribitylamino)uracil phosphatase YigB [[Haemophilus] felis]OOS06387.1 HAD family hydrolase [[Haemophilus] felis]
MKFYRNLQPFKVISFDLDDTLYDNSMVIALAEQKFLTKLQQESQLTELDSTQWRYWKSKVMQQDPILCEDVIAWRITATRILLQHHHKKPQEIQRIIQSSMAEFIEWRHKISIPTQTFEVLNKLTQRYPLIAITNGNVDPKLIGLDYFKLVLRGGEHGRAKPHSQLFHQTAQHFQISPQNILHIGDHLVSDVQGAIQAGCQAIWINVTKQHINQCSETTLLPTLEIAKLDELLKFIN